MAGSVGPTKRSAAFDRHRREFKDRASPRMFLRRDAPNLVRQSGGLLLTSSFVDVPGLTISPLVYGNVLALVVVYVDIATTGYGVVELQILLAGAAESELLTCSPIDTDEILQSQMWLINIGNPGDEVKMQARTTIAAGSVTLRQDKGAFALIATGGIAT